MKTTTRAAGTVLSVALLMACGSSDEQVARSDERVPTQLMEAILTDPSTLNVVVASCNQQPTAEVTEDDDVVRVTAYERPPTQEAGTAAPTESRCGWRNHSATVA